MKNKLKTKHIQKEIKKRNKNKQQSSPKNEGQPQLKSLTDFVTALTPVYANKPIYTGGRIILNHDKIYASCNQQIAIYDLKQKIYHPRIKIINEQIVNFALNQSGSKIAIFTQNGLFRIMDTNTLKVLQLTKFNNKFFANDIAFSPDSKYIALGFASQFVKIFTVQTLKQTHSYQHSAPVRKIQWHPNPQNLQLISSDDSRKISVFDYIANKIVKNIEAGHTFCLTNNGKSIVSIINKQVKVVDFKTFNIQYSFEAQDYLDCIYAYGQNILFGGVQTELFYWKLGQQVRIIEKGTQKGVSKIIGWQKQKKCIVVSSEQNLISIDLKTITPIDVTIGFNDQIIDIKFSKGQPSSQFLMITNSNNAKLINSNTHNLTHMLQGHSDIILCGEYWHPWIATAGKDRVIKLWKLNHQKQAKIIANYNGHSSDICGIGYLPKSHLLVSVGEDKTIKIWSVCDASPDTIQINSAIRTIMGHQKTINAVRVSAKMEYIATCSHDRSVKIWDIYLNKIFTLTGHKRGVWDATFHDKQALLVTAGGDGMLKGWSMVDGSCIWSMGEGACLVRCQWIYEHQVVTGSIDGILKIWDIRKKTSLSYDKHQGKIWALQVRKNQQNKCQIITGANDSVYQIWVDSTEETRSKILKKGQQQQKERVLLEQFREQKNYVEAAKTAFFGGYSQIFSRIIQELFGYIIEQDQFKMDQQGEIKIQQTKIAQEQKQKIVTQIIEYCIQTDPHKLLTLILTLNTTVRHFKSANVLLKQLLKQQKILGLNIYDKSYMLPKMKQSIQQNETDYEKYLKNMFIYTDKHLNRMEKYYRSSFWIDHLQQIQNPNHF